MEEGKGRRDKRRQHRMFFRQNFFGSLQVREGENCVDGARGKEEKAKEKLGDRLLLS